MGKIDITLKASGVINRLALEQAVLSEARECCFNMKAADQDTIIAKMNKRVDGLVNSGKLYNSIYDKVTATVKKALESNGLINMSYSRISVEDLVQAVMDDSSVDDKNVRCACEDYMKRKGELAALQNDLDESFRPAMEDAYTTFRPVPPTPYAGEEARA